MLIMGSLRQWLLLIAMIFNVIKTMRSSPAGATKDHEDLESLLVRAVRHVAFRGQSQRHGLPGTNNGHCDCQYHMVCASQLDKITSTCRLPGGVTGVCCPPVGGGRNGLRKRIGAGKLSSVLQQPKKQPQATSRNVNFLNMVNNALLKGIKEVEEFSEIEKRLSRKDIVLKRGTPASNHLRVYQTPPETKEIHKKALIVASASAHMRSNLKLPNCAAITSLLDAFGLHNSIFGKYCPEQLRCPNPNTKYSDGNSKYRTADGSCNNLNNPEWGMSNTALSRLLPPKYEDCIRSPRVTSVTGKPLPSARRLINNILIDIDQPDLRFTLSLMQWAQFIDHDLTHSPFPTMEEDKGIQCCKPDNTLLPPEDLHPMCMPIEIPKEDAFFFAQRGQTCMNFVRSSLAMDSECRFGFQENVNILTQWLDGSTVYGQNQYDQNILRTNHSGTLKTSANNFLPEDPAGGGAECNAVQRGGICFLAGESRVNEQPGLTLMHTIWMRQHNRIARELQHWSGGHWSDEAVFQETRRIIAAQIAHITYNEWLPIIVGEDFVTQFELLPQRSGFSSDYDPRINANSNQEFSTAAFRFGHSLVQGIMKLLLSAPAERRVSSNLLRNNFMTGQLITHPGFFDGFLRGLTRQPPQKFDNSVTEELTNHLFQSPNQTFGMDLQSLNIQRGRDHAIGTYNEARVLCGLRKADSFNDLTDHIPRDTVQQMQRLYQSVDDIDMFIGGISETAVFGGILGPTFLCIVGDQFARLKRGDRHFYELQGQPGSFTSDQLQEIRRTSWARIVCDNSNNLDSIQPLAFKMPNMFNPLVSCHSPMIPKMNLEHWRGEHPQA